MGCWGLYDSLWPKEDSLQDKEINSLTVMCIMHTAISSFKPCLVLLNTIHCSIWTTVCARTHCRYIYMLFLYSIGSIWQLATLGLFLIRLIHLATQFFNILCSCDKKLLSDYFEGETYISGFFDISIIFCSLINEWSYKSPYIKLLSTEYFCLALLTKEDICP